MCIRDMTDVGDRGGGASRGLQDVVACWRELQPPPRALEEYASELLLEFVQCPRDRGLGDAQAIGGIGERAVFRKAHQITKMLQVHEVRQLPPRMAVSRLRAILRSLRSDEHTSELQSLMRISYAVFCLKKNKKT